MATKAELTTGSVSAATEHTEEPQLAELVTQEAGLSTEIDLKVIRNDLVHYNYTFKGSQVVTQKVQIVLQSKQAEQYCLGVAKLESAGRLAEHGGSKPLHSSMRSRLIFTLHVASQSICGSRRRKRCYRARLSRRRQCQQLQSPTYCRLSKQGHVATCVTSK